MWRGWVSRSDTVRVLAQSIRAGLAKAAEKRRFGRVRLAGRVECSLGRIVDLSRGGLRVVSKQRFEGEGTVTIKANGRELLIPTRVVWCRKAGFRRYELGLEFTRVTEEVARMLEALAAS